MKKLSIFLFILGLFSSQILKAYSPEPESFVNELVNEAISILSDKNLNIEDSEFVSYQGKKCEVDDVDMSSKLIHIYFK